MSNLNRQYSLGLDYGTESARAVLLDVKSGELLRAAECSYRHGVIDSTLPTNSKVRLPKDWALQHPRDWIESFEFLVKSILKKSSVRSNQIIGIGIDFTSCTILPTTQEGIALSELPQFKKNPHAWPKLWKHHGAWREAEQINQAARERNEKFLKRYGGKISSEWMLPKLLEILHHSRDVSEAMDKYIEAQDWLVWRITGKEARSACGAGYKGTWSKKEGFPSEDLLKELDPQLPGILQKKFGSNFYPPGHRAGTLSAEWAKRTGLEIGTPVATSIIDAHASFLGSGVAAAGEMVLCMGTSTCHLLLGEEYKEVPGIAGVVEDGILPGYFGYEAGQAAVGDSFSWFVKNACPSPAGNTKNTFTWLEKEAGKLKAGQNGLLALDWWNGNRSILVDANLSGAIFGLTLSTTPPEIYRALLEATAFGTLMIIQQLENSKVPVKKLIATGGIAQKSPLLLQIYADITNRPIELVEASHLSARGAAILGTLAWGEDLSRETVQKTIRRCSPHTRRCFNPSTKNIKVYEKLYKDYSRLHDYFGRGENNILKNLKTLSAANA